MGNSSNYLQNQLVDHLFRGATFAKPANLFFALFTVAPGPAGGGTEVTGGSYARVQITPSNTSFQATQGGTSGASTGTTGNTTNAVAITFPAPTANWGTCVAYSILDASSGGNFLIYGSLNTAKTINGGDAAPSFSIGNLSVTIN